MSLLDNGPDVLEVRTEQTVTDGRRNVVRAPSGEPVIVRGRLQPLSSAESHDDDGQSTSTLYRFVTRSFPGGPWAAVTALDGAAYDVVGDPSLHNGSDRTRHVTVTLRQRGVRNLGS